ncbi:hypothetical protein [uncultured Flavobacterium sp.]|uniref:hypothetical protein n=1 Tax=uncultured Flavobacterium sp. TaxID=165435 RepID=UPI0030C8A0AB
MKNLFNLILLLVVCPVFAQHICGTIDEEPSNVQFKTIANPNAPNLTEPVAYNVFFQIITNDDGTRNIPIAEAEMQEAIKILNTKFNQFNIFFKYRGYQYIPSSFFMNVQLYDNTGIDNSYYDLLSFASSQDYLKTDAFNIFVTETILNGQLSIYNGVTSLYSSNLCIKDTRLNTRTLVHELGHCFGLYHVNNINNGLTENITRDVTSPNYNALTHGDRVHDTPATPLSLPPYEINNCIWTGVQYDPVGEQYGNIALDNFVLSVPLACDNLNGIFTTGQGERMRWNISHTYPGYENKRTPIEELYKPFEVIDVPGDVVISVSDDIPGDGMATVCRNILRQHRFQKGFSYEFNNTYSPDPVSATINEIPVVKHNTYQFGVKILQLDNPNSTYGNYIHNVDVVCTKGQICTNEPYLGGKIISVGNIG